MLNAFEYIIRARGEFNNNKEAFVRNMNERLIMIFAKCAGGVI